MKNDIDYKTLQSQTIDWLRFPLIIAVVFMHTTMPEADFSSCPGWLASHGNSILNSIFLFCSSVGTRIAVPAFYLISGYLFFLNTPQLTNNTYKGKMRKRFHSLLIPYIIWNLVPVLIFFALEFVKLGITAHDLPAFCQSCITYMNDNGWLRVFWNWKPWDEGISWIGTSTTMTSPIDYPLWYLRDLIVMTTLTPIFYWLVRKLNAWFVVICFIVWFPGLWTAVTGISSMGIMFFGLGAYMAINRLNLIETFRKIEKLSYILAPFFLVADIVIGGKVTTLGYFLFHCYIVFGVVAAFNFASRLLEKGRVKVHRTLTNSVFFVYAFHTILFVGKYDEFVAKLWFMTGNTPLLAPFIYLTTPFVKTAICVIVYVLLRRFMPRLTKVLTGSR